METTDRPERPDRSVFRVVARNGAIHTFEQSVNVLLGFAATIAVARAFGPEVFGVWTVALFVMRVVSSLAGYGLDILVMKNCEAQDAEAKRFIATALAMRFFNTLAVAIAGVTVFAVFLGPEGLTDSPLVLLLVVMSPALLFMPLDVFEFWFRAARNALVPALARISAAVMGTGLKLYVIFIGGGIALLGLTHTVQLAMPGAVFLISLILTGTRLSLSSLAKGDILRLYRHAFPLFISQIGLVAAMRLDIVILSLVGNERDVGLYSASLRICEAAYLLPVILMTAGAPFLFHLAKTDTRNFIRVFHTLLTIFNVCAVLTALVVSVLAPSLVIFLFGPQYAQAATVLAIQIFALVGVSQAVATEYWWIARGRTRVSLQRTITGAVTIAMLSLLLVPFFGAVGAAIANVAAAFASGAGVHLFLGRNGRQLWRLQTVPNLLALWDWIGRRDVVK